MAITIDELEIQIQTEASKASSGIDALTNSLQKLELAIGGSSGLTSNLTQIATALKTFDANPIKQVAKGIERLFDATKSIDGTKLEVLSTQMRGIAGALQNLNGVGKSNISSIVNAVKKIPEITAKLDPATIEAFTTKIQILTSAVTPLGIQMDKIASGFKSLNSATKNVTSGVDKVSEAAKGAKTSFGGLTSSLTGTIAKFTVLYMAVSRVVDVLADAFNTSNDYVESLNLFKVTMGDTAVVAEKFAKNVSEIMGIDPAEWMQNQGMFQRLATGFGISADQADIMSQNLTQLAYDMASFFNTDVETAMQKLQSGMSGQIKGLKAWGYNLSVAALQETALSLGIEQSVRTMTEAQKAQLRYITLIQKSNGVMGDMAKTLNTPANAMRVLKAQLTQLERAFGNIVSVLVTKFIPYFQAFVKLVTEAAEALAVFMGFEIKDLPTNNLDMAEDVIDGIGESAEDANGTIEELKRQLAGFDEVNILKSDTNNKSAEYDLGFTMPEYDFLGNAFSEYTKYVDDFKETVKGIFDDLDFEAAVTRVKEFISTIKEQFSTLDFKTPLVETVTNMFAALIEIATLAVNTVAPVFEALNVPQILLDGLELLSECFKTIGDVVGAVTPALTAFTESFSPIIAWISGALSEGLNSITEVIGKAGEKFVELEPSITSVGEALSEVVTTLWEFIEPLVSTIWSDGTVSVLESLSDAILTLNDCIVTLLGVVAGGFNEKFSELTDVLTPLRDFLAGALSDAFSVVSSVLQMLSEDVLPPLTETLSNLWNSVLSPLVGLINSMLAPAIQIISDVLSFLHEHVVLPLADALNGVLGVAFEAVFSILNSTVIPILSTAIEILTLLWEEVLAPIADFVWDIFGPAFEESFVVIEDLLTSFETTLSGLILFIQGSFTGDWETAWQGIATTAEGIWSGLETSFNSFNSVAEKGFETLGDKWDEFTETPFGSWVDEYIVQPVDNAFSSISQFASDCWDDIVEFFSPAVTWFDELFAEVEQTLDDAFYNIEVIGSGCWEVTKTAWGEASSWFDENVVQPSSEVFGELWDDFLVGAEDAWDGCKEAFAPAATFFGDIFSEAWAKVVNVFSPIGDVFVKIKDGVLAGFKTVVNGLIRGLNETIAIPFEGINTAISLIRDISIFDIQPFADLKTISIPEIPMLASGGFPSMGQMFIARENGPELVGRIGNKNAVANNEQITAGIASAVYSAMMAAQEDSNNSEGGSARIVVQIGDQAVGEASVRYINGKIIQTGTSPIYS